jgi:hypothetical protein
MSIVKRGGWPYSDMPGLFNDFFSRDLWNWGLKTIQQPTPVSLPLM